MAFKKVEKTTRAQVGYPAIRINKAGQATLNSFWLKEIGIDVAENKGEPQYIKFDILFDEETGRLAISLSKKGSEKKKVYKDRKQVVFYVKTLFKSIGYQRPKGTFRLEKIEDEDFGDIWVADLGDLKKLGYGTDEEKDAARVVTNSKKKRRRKKKTK